MRNAAQLNSSGIALTEANRPGEAIPFFKEALLLEPDNALLWLNLGIAQQKSGDYEEALSSFGRAVAIDEGEASAWSSMALIYYETGNFELSEQCYHNALNCCGGSPETWNNLGVLYFNLERDADARACFEQAVTLAPHYADALLNLRDVCRRQGDYRAASEFARICEEPGLARTSSADAQERRTQA